MARKSLVVFRRCITVGSVFALLLVSCWPAARSQPAPAPRSLVVARQVAAAGAYATQHHVRVGIAVLDLKTGAYYHSGEDTRLFGTASVVKVMIATRMLLTGRMTGANRSIAWDMIVRSNDVAASVLWPEEGGPQLVPWIARHYGIASLGTPNIHPGYWGNTHVTARGLVQLYRAVSTDPRVAPWLLAAMHHYQCTAWDGTDQCFGLPAVTAGSGIKQGWGSQSADDWADAIVNSTGFVNHNRYAVAILSEGENNNASTDGRGFNAGQAAIVTHLAALLAPAGLVDTPARHDPVLHVDSITSRGNTVTVRGWAFDPDAPHSALTVTVASAAHALGHSRTLVLRPGVNRQFGLSGVHGFVLRVIMRNGRPTVCATTANVAAGAAGARSCRSTTVDGRARGGFNRPDLGAGAPVLSGWTSDPDSGMRSTSVLIDDNGRPVGTFPADRYDRAVDQRFHLTGRHAFRITLAAPDGTHDYCAYALNTGPSVSPARVLLGCRKTRVANDPVGALDPLTTSAGTIHVSGWAYDPTRPTTSIQVQIDLDDTTSTVVAQLPSAEVDAAQHITGAHRFAVDLPAAAGDHTVTVSYLNLGAGAATPEAPQTVTVPAA